MAAIKDIPLHGNPLVRFKIDGVVKSPSGPITGESLYALAGNPALLVSDGSKVEKNDKPIAVHHDQEFVTMHSLGNKDELNPEHVIPADEAVVDPPHGQVVEHVSKPEADEIRSRQKAAAKQK